MIDPTAFFLTFNYTPSLQELYGVPDRRILHIHGEANLPDSDLILGHAWHVVMKTQLVEVQFLLGMCTTDGAGAGKPQRLARPGPGLGVLNQGISGDDQEAADPALHFNANCE